MEYPINQVELAEEPDFMKKASPAIFPGISFLGEFFGPCKSFDDLKKTTLEYLATHSSYGYDDVYNELIYHNCIGKHTYLMLSILLNIRFNIYDVHYKILSIIKDENNMVTRQLNIVIDGDKMDTVTVYTENYGKLTKRIKLEISGFAPSSNYEQEIVVKQSHNHNDGHIEYKLKHWIPILNNKMSNELMRKAIEDCSTLGLYISDEHLFMANIGFLVYQREKRNRVARLEADSPNRMIMCKIVHDEYGCYEESRITTKTPVDAYIDRLENYTTISSLLYVLNSKELNVLENFDDLAWKLDSIDSVPFISKAILFLINVSAERQLNVEIYQSITTLKSECSGKDIMLRAFFSSNRNPIQILFTVSKFYILKNKKVQVYPMSFPSSVPITTNELVIKECDPEPIHLLIGDQKEGEAVVFNSDINIPIPNFKYIGLNKKTGNCEFTVEDELCLWPVAKGTGNIHDFTFSKLVKSTDKKFSDLGLILEDGDDNKSPDYMYFHTNRKGVKELIIVEFTTSQSPHLGSLQKAFTGKKLKYSEMIKARCSKYKLVSKYFIICVSRNRVLTDLVLKEDVINSLVLRYKLGLAMYNSALEKEDMIKEETEMSTAVKRIKSLFTSVKNDHFTNIDQKMYESLSAAPVQGDFEEVKILLTKSLDIIMKEQENKMTLSDDVFDSLLLKKTQTYDLNLKSFHSRMCIAETRNDNKAPVQHPLLYAHERTIEYMSKNTLDDLPDSSHCAIYNLWCVASKGKIKMEEDLITEAERIFHTEKEQVEIEESQKKYRRQRDRYKYKIPHHMEVELAKIGINGKKYSNDPEVRLYRSEKKKPFSYFETPTEDIDSFIQSTNLSELFSKSKFYDARQESVLNLLKEALRIHNTSDSSKFSKIVIQYSESKIGTYLRLVSDLAFELSSSLKQNMDYNSVIIKRLKHFPIYIMIKTTRLNSKMFYSLLWDGRAFHEPSGEDRIFKKVNKVAHLRYTDFVSTDIAKLTNLCRAESIGLSILMFWLEQFSVTIDVTKPIDLIDLCSKDLRVVQMFKFCLLVLFNDKHYCEELITLSRFIHMESLVVFPNFPNPSKMLDKIENTFRSRLEVWIAKRLVALITEYTVKDSTHLKSMNENYRVWEGFLNPFILDGNGLSKFNNQDEMLSSCYLGYLKNKDETSEVNASGKLLSKILGMENQLPKSDVYLGRENPKFESIQKHEFNLSMIKVMSNMFLKSLKKEKGYSNIHSVKEYLALKIMEKLNHQDLETFASLKASSNFSPEFYIFDKNKPYHRSKVIEKVISKLKEKMESDKDVLVVDLMMEALEILELDSSLHICIFKKNQHGGLREIYVLDLNGRIVQKIIEDFARSILIEIESETMTHPNNKFRIPEEHNRKSKKLFKNQYLTLTTSDDAAKWNQGHYVTKFMCMFYQLLPKYLHGFITRCLQLWLNKKIKISDDLLSLFDSLSEMKTRDDVVKEIFEVYKGKKISPWMKPNCSYIQTKSGMMQGILHYTSSLFHSLFLLHLKDLSYNLLKEELMDSKKTNQKSIIDNMQSSDDSSFIISIFKYPDPPQMFSSLLTVQKCFRLKDILGEQIGIYRSIKSTTMTLFINEFNSEFFFLGDVHRPTFRWVNASISMTEQETLIARQEESYNLLTNVVQGGGTILLSHIIQWAQGLLHYRLLGSSLSDLWPLYSNLIKTMKDPALGFFLMDHPMLAGVPGLNYNLWLTCKKTILGRKYHDMFTESLNAEDKSIKEITAETASIGLFSRSTTVSWQSSKKWRELTRQLEMDDDWVDYIDKEPSILYFRPKTIKELRLKLGIKLKSPGVISSLGKSNAIPRVIASGVYILSRPVLHTQSTYYLNELERNTNRITLTTELLRSIDRYITNSFDQEAIHKDVTNRTEYVKSQQNDYNLYKFTSSQDVVHILSKKFLAVKKLGDKILMAILNRWNLKNSDERCSKYSSLVLEICKFANISMVVVDNHKEKVLPIYYHYSGSYDVINSISIDNFEATFGYIPFTVGRDQNFDKMGLTIHEERILFPHIYDYENIKSISDGLNTNVSKPTRNNRRRQRSNIVVTGSHYTDNTKIKMEDVLVWKWFNIDRLKISRDALQILFNKYCNWIPWLNEDIHITLRQSPFQNHIQLQNFISRQDLSPRIVHLVGSYGKNRYGTISLPNVIKNNFSNSITFPEIIDSASKFKYEHSTDILHILTCLSQSAITQRSRNLLVYDLLLHSRPIIENLIPGSVINKLQIIQEFAVNCPDMILENNLSSQELKSIIANSNTKLKQMKSKEELNDKISMIMEEFENSEMDFVDFILDKDLDWPLEEMEQLQEYYDNDEVDYNAYVKRFKENISAEDSNFEDIIRYNGKSGLKLMKDLNLTLQNIEEMGETFASNIHSLFAKIREMRLGITGYYSLLQKYDKNKRAYYGKGQWIGRFENVDIEINIISSGDKTLLESIQINTARSFDMTLKYIKAWCKENNVQNDPYFKHSNSSKNLITRLLNFEEVRTSGCPIFIKEELQTIMEQRFIAFKIDLSSRSLRLLGYYDNPNIFNAKFSTLVYIPLNAHHINEHFSMRSEFEMINSWPKHVIDWILWKPISKEGIHDLINETSNQIFIDNSDLIPWIQSLREAYHRRILTVKPKFEKEEEDELIPELTEEELNKMKERYSKMMDNIKLNTSSLHKLQNLHKDVESILTTMQFYEEKDEYMNILIETHPYFRGFSSEFPDLNNWISITESMASVSKTYQSIKSFLEILLGKQIHIIEDRIYTVPKKDIKNFL